jgi:hypothetical protein
MEKQTLIEVIKANKKTIIKRALIIGGTIAGLALVMHGVQKVSTEDEVDSDAEDTCDEAESSDVEA